MNVLITGAAGFVGKNLTEYLSGKVNVFAPEKAELDLLNEQAVINYIHSNKIEAVVHCAVVGATRKTDNLPHIVSNNLRMFLNLAGQNKFYKKMIHFGSGAEFDKRRPLVKVTEDFKSTILPQSDYGFSKYLCSHFQQHYDNIFNLRIFGVYGKYDDYVNRFISNATCRAVLGLPLVVYQNQLMDFIFIDDLVKVVEFMLTADPKYKSYNVSSGNPLHLVDIAKTILDVSGKNLEIKVLDPVMANEYTCDNSRLKSEMPLFKATDFKKSLEQTYHWYSEHQDLINKSELI